MTRLAIVGLDGATFDVIRPMVAAGELPHIARILRDGASGVLESETPPITPPAWASMMTGLNPGRHGIYHFVRRELGAYGVKLVDSRNFAGKDLMSVLGRRGWSAAAINVPMTYPTFPLRGGYMVAGIPCPLEGDSLAWPEGVKAELDAALGHPYRPDMDFSLLDKDRERPADDLDMYAQLRDELFAVERDRIRLLREWAPRRPVDLFFTVVSLPDRCHHFFWKFQDPSHAGYTPEGARRYGEVIRDSYRVADEYLGAVRALVGEQTPICILSDHGSGSYNLDFRIILWLEQQGFLARRKVPYFTWGRTTLADAVRRAGMPGLGRRLGPLGRLPVARPKIKRVPDARDVIWSRTRAFASMHGICVNLRGREPQGVVPPGEGMQRTLEEVERKLAELRGPDGQPLLDRLVRAPEIYSGPHAAEAPDLQFQLRGISCLPVEEWSGDGLFVVRRNAGVSGQHRFEGIFALAGPGIAAGRPVHGMHIRDVTPTLFLAAGEAVPAWMEGRARAEILERPRPPEFDPEPEPQPGAGAGDVFSDAESAAIEESLRGLGYLQ
ncbi:MAG: hypothetical protein EYC70_05800 [Planctomycetota bacterium]|nr:MAG: hypothetical protein EYC70_05800 [Planctomycetota bacterium]